MTEDCADPVAARRNLDLLRSAWPPGAVESIETSLRPALVSVLSASDFLAEALARNPDAIDVLGAAGAPAVEVLERALETATEGSPALPHWRLCLRRFRMRELLRIAAADLTGRSSFEQTTGELSVLADVVLRACLSGIARAQGPLVLVLALGKLGGEELNYSSDVDLLFVVGEAQELEPATRTAQRFVQELEERADGEGFLYRVDVRLRPFGRAGAFVVTTRALLEYLEHTASAAERQAMLRARRVCGDPRAAALLLEGIARCIYARPSGARQAVLALKRRIEHEIGRGGSLEDDLKHGPGGIRDVEFVVQALQLEEGGARADLRTGNTLHALGRLVGSGLLAVEPANTLREGYVFLRTVEHRLQLIANLQRHVLPADPAVTRRLARLCGFREPGREADLLRAAVRAETTRVRRVFEDVMQRSDDGGRR